MRYIGKFSLISIALLFAIFQIFILKEPVKTQGFDSIIAVLIAWFVGSQFEKMRFYAEKDYLTGVYNRRFAEKLFPKLKTKADKNKKTIGVFILDINNFKSINDTYGHKSGDDVLKMLSDSIIKCTRKSDVVIRWGGDEFMIFAPTITEDFARDVASRINTEFKETINKNKTLNLTTGVAIGYAIYPKHATNFEQLIHLADENMYQNKNGGDSRVCNLHN
jgi:diguanylate cyclase (GGDEF)-like protein